MANGKPPRTMTQVKQWQRGAARDYYLRHPDASISDVSRATNISERTVARAREALVKAGLLAPGRNAETPVPSAAAVAQTVSAQIAATSDEVAGAASEPSGDAEEPASPPRRGPGRPPKSGALLDDEAIRAMSGMLDELSESEDVETTRKRMLKQTQRFVFDPTLHPDTRMSASQLWAKLVDMARTKDLGGGKPMTLALAVERCEDFLLACGPTVYVPALNNVIAKMEAANAGKEAVDTSHAAPAPDPLAGTPVDDTGTVRPA